MKRLLSLIFITTITFLYSSVGFAEGSIQFYEGFAHQKISGLYPPTDVAVINASCCIITGSVTSNPPTDFVVKPRTALHLFNSSARFPMTILMRDVGGSVIFNQSVCPVAVLVVFGSPGDYSVLVDSNYCT